MEEDYQRKLRQLELEKQDLWEERKLQKAELEVEKANMREDSAQMQAHVRQLQAQFEAQMRADVQAQVRADMAKLQQNYQVVQPPFNRVIMPDGSAAGAAVYPPHFSYEDVVNYQVDNMMMQEDISPKSERSRLTESIFDKFVRPVSESSYQS